MIAIGEHPDGCVLPVRAQPSARRAGVVGEHNGALKIAVTVPPDGGRANEALLDVIRKVFSLKRSQVELLNGVRSRDKKFLLRALARPDLEARLQALLK